MSSKVDLPFGVKGKNVDFVYMCGRHSVSLYIDMLLCLHTERAFFFNFTSSRFQAQIIMPYIIFEP